MSKSIEYIKSRIENKDNTNMELSFDDWYEVSPEHFLKFDEDHKSISNFTDDSNELNIEIEITYDPEADFEYFTTSSEKHDGSICYEAECAHRCVLKILELKTYNKNIKIPEGYGNYKFKYTIGNIVVVNEYDEKFANTDKPWTNEKTTALLPIIFRCEVVY